MIQTDLYSFGCKIGTLVPWCKQCGTQNFYKDGKNRKGIQIYKCKKCGSRFVWTSDLPKRNFFSNIMSFAVEMYTTVRISLRELASKMSRFFKVKVSYETIRQWILTSKKQPLSCRKKWKATRWHVDENHIKIKGRGYWLWVVFCRDTKLVLSWHISKKRTVRNAKIVLRKALSLTKVKPKKITTDGLKQYSKAIKKVMGWHWRKQRKKHIVSGAFGKNAIIERVNREIKRRTKWFSTFQKLKGARAFFGFFFYHYNQRKIETQHS